MPKSFDVFLSHNSTDKPWVEKLKNALESKNIRVWLDKDQIRPGDTFAEALEKGFGESRSVALIVSPEAMSSGWVKLEYYRALSLVSADVFREFSSQFPLNAGMMPMVVQIALNLRESTLEPEEDPRSSILSVGRLSHITSETFWQSLLTESGRTSPRMLACLLIAVAQEAGEVFEANISTQIVEIIRDLAAGPPWH